VTGEDVILMAHGAGGARTRSIVADLILKHLGNPVLDRLDDAACLDIPGQVVFTTDSYVVDPVFFPGGDIGRLSACGTINDLAMQGGRPEYLSLGLIIEEGFPINRLETVVASLADVLNETGVKVATGDTKVIERRSASREPGLLVNTAGIGVRQPGVDVHVANARPGDNVIVTGTMGDHGVAVISRREGLRFESDIVSDVAPLWEMIGALLEAVPAVKCLRDPTRGGLAAALCDIADASGTGILVRERDIPVLPAVRSACNLLGLDPLNVANEGKAVVVCSNTDTETAVGILREHSLGLETRVIGEVVTEPAGMVLLQTTVGGEHIVELPDGEDLPRIC
jgi:hydrogenase expression/formation protein HypE